MRATVWGPPLWHVLFCSASACTSPERVAAFRELLERQLPQLLPCPVCRRHYATNLARVNRQTRGFPHDAESAVRWCWFLKDHVNRSLGVPSLSFTDLTSRLLLHGAVVDEVRTVDMLVLVAVFAHSESLDDLFVALCDALVRVAPFRTTSVALHFLRHVAHPIVPTTLRCARETRKAADLPVLALATYLACGA
jgi:hypothetical protein